MIPKNFTVAEIDELIEAKKYIFSGKPYPLEIVSEEIKKLIGKVEWANGADLSEDLQKITSTDSLEKTEKVLSGWKQEVSEKPVESTVPQKEQLEKLKEEAEKRRVAAKESVQSARTKQEQWLKLQKEKLLKVPPKEEQEKILTELKRKIVYVVPEKPEPEIKLTEQEQTFTNLAKQNPRVFEKKLTEDIIQKNPEIFASPDLKPLADVISADTTSVFIDPSNKPIPTGVFAALAKQKELPEVQKTGALFTLISEEKQNLYREILNRTLGMNLANKVLGLPETVYELSQTSPEKTEGSFSIKLDTLQANSFRLQEGPLNEILNNPSLSEARNIVSLQLKESALSKVASLPKTGFFGRISQFTTSRTFDSIAPFLGLPTQMTYTGTSFFGKMITTFLPEYAPLITNFSAKLGIDIGIKALAPVAAETVGTGITTAAGGAAVKTGLSATISTFLSTTFGSFAPIVGHVIGAAIGWLAGKAIQPLLNWVKKHQEDLKIVGLLMLGGGLIMQSLPLMVFGGLIFAPLALRTGVSMAGIAARTTFLFGRIGASVAITIGTPIIVAIVVFPILIAIILFIINSGAYIVPPGPPDSPFVGGGESVACSDQKGAVGANSPSSASTIANRAWKITYDLYQGFWCYWNRSPGKPPHPDFPNDVVTYPPSYPNLFDYSLFKRNPFPPPSGTYNLFWCSWLVVKAYHENGNQIQPNLYTPNMYVDFNNRGKIIKAADASPNNIVPGSVIFFHVLSGQNRINHVGVVYSVDPGGLVLVQSNSPTKSQSINFSPGGGVGNLPGIETVAFGLP